MKKTILITGSNGFIATNFCATFIDKYNFIKISHQPISGHVTLEELKNNLELIKSIDVVINLAGANIGEKRWNNNRKQVLVNSRVDTTKSIVKLLTTHNSNAHLISASAIGVYPTNKMCDENTEIDYSHYASFSEEITKRWELEAFKYKGKLTITRFGVVLDATGGAFVKMLRPFLFFAGGHLGDGEQYFPWIALPDLLNSLDFIINNGDIGVFNCVAPELITNKRLSQAIAKTWHRPCMCNLPKVLIKLLFGQMGQELFLNSIQVTPKRLLNTQFKYTYSTIDSCLKNIHSK